jgi:hypothetical protein
MKTEPLALSDPRLLAEFIRHEQFKGFFEKRFEVPPDHLGLLIRNGEFVRALKGGHLSVGGVLHHLKGVIGGSHAVSLVLADLRPFAIRQTFKAISKDHAEILGVATIELQVDPEKPANIVGMMEGRKALAKADLGERLKPHLSDRVIEGAVSRLDAGEVRGNAGLQDMIQAEIMKACERIFGDAGVMVRSVSMEWALNDVERADMERAAAERAADKIEFDFATLKRSLEREHETTQIRIASKLDIDRLNLASEADLERLVLDQELAFLDARESGQRLQEMKVLQHEIELMRTERMAKFDEAIAGAGHTVDLRSYDEKRRVVERATAELDQQHRLKLAEAQRDYDAETRAKERDYGLDTRREEVRVREVEQKSALELQRDADKAALEKLRGLEGLQAEMDRRRLEERIREGDAEHKREMEQRRLEAQREVDRLQLGAKMTPEQILAINAGLSPDVANVLAEQARAQGQNNAQSMELMRQMVEQANAARLDSAQQAREFFQMGMQGAVGVAAGAGPKGGDHKAAAVGVAGDGRIECPKCGRANTARARFCVGCGEQLRK